MDILEKKGSLHSIGIKGSFMDTKKKNKLTTE